MRITDAQILSYSRLLCSERDYESLAELSTSISHHHKLEPESIKQVISHAEEWWSFPFFDTQYGIVVPNEHGIMVTETCLQMVGGWDITQPRHTGHLQRIQLTAKVYLRDGEWLGIGRPWTEQYVENVQMDDIPWLVTMFQGEQYRTLEEIYGISARHRRRKLRGFEWLIGALLQNMSAAQAHESVHHFTPNALGEAILPLLVRWAEDWKYLLGTRRDLRGKKNGTET